ncbi:MAG: hypothetical protein M1825_000720 [Sarcosagium campestre]|nr:MAG: hypothetical protein M1825_000720 [Sarcosagium campestre]
MGNSSTKEQRVPPSPTNPRSGGQRYAPSLDSSASADTVSSSYHADRHPPTLYNSRGSRLGGPDLSFLGLNSNSNSSERDSMSQELRKEIKQDREARRAERERVARAKERERSMREESVDGGYLVTQGVYTGPEDFNKIVVRQLMIERRLAPFFKGLNDHSSHWTDAQLVDAVGSLEATASGVQTESEADASSEQPRKLNLHLHGLTLPMSSRSQSYSSDRSSDTSSSHPTFPLSQAPSPLAPSSNPSVTPFRPRSKTLASLTTFSKPSNQNDMMPQEHQIPAEPFVDGRPIQAWLYERASECPICFLYYPPYINKTRCCDQAICSECFVQIKRPDPHLPEHGDPTSSAPVSSLLNAQGASKDFVSEPAACPFCVQPEFGITYEPPPIRRGLTYANGVSPSSVAGLNSAMSSSSSLSSMSGSAAHNPSLMESAFPAKRRTTSISANAPSVITTDRVRPDWAQKLANARAHAARRSAAATALHTAAYMMGGSNSRDVRGFGAFGRRSSRGGREIIISDSTGPAGSSRGHTMTIFPGDSESTLVDSNSEMSQRRARMEDIEDMMFTEAIRLSLLAEEERKKKEEKEARNNAKKKEKETRRAERVTRVTPPPEESYDDASAPTRMLANGSSADGKGKGVDRTIPDAAASPGLPTFDDPPSPIKLPHLFPDPTPALEPSDLGSHAKNSSSSITGPTRPSHLRHVSHTSSSDSSVIESAPSSIRAGFHGSLTSLEGSVSAGGGHVGYPGTSDNASGSSTPAGGTCADSIFNFQSLAAMIGVDDNPSLDSSAQVDAAKSSTVRDGTHTATAAQRPVSAIPRESKHSDEVRIVAADRHAQPLGEE